MIDNADMATRFATKGAEILPELVELRRALHADPELGLDLPRTQQKVLEAIDGLGLEITLGEGLSSVVAVLRGGMPGPTVLLRGDMDALHVTESNDLPYRSTNRSMHACGHDLHTSGLVGAARLLADVRDSIAGNVIFMFQPGEEGDAGAMMMIEEGLLDASGELPIAAYAIHVAPGPRGVFALKSGTVAAGSNLLSVTITGKGGHGSNPISAVDPVPILAECVLALQTFVTRRFDVFDPIVLSVTQLSAGTADNVIPEKASLRGTIRTMSEATLDRVQTELPRLVSDIAAAHGATAEARVEVLYPVTINDLEVTDAAFDAITDLFGERVIRLPQPVMGSEDFSFVAQRIPSSFLLLMASPPELDQNNLAYNHSPLVFFDDSVLGDQAAALATLAFSTLNTRASAPEPTQET